MNRKAAAAQITRRIRAEYLEMPGLFLRPEQVQRLCGVDSTVCRYVLEALVENPGENVAPNWKQYLTKLAREAGIEDPTDAELRRFDRKRKGKKTSNDDWKSPSDPDARFKFVRVARYPGAPGEFRFDMVPAEFTHDGDMCTFEVLLERFDLHEPGLVAISEVVHDIDLKDEKFGRSEAPGIEAVLGGIVNAVPDDDARLAAAFPLFDALYDRFRASAG